jgi:glutamate synthase domain-containing protein 2
MESPNTDKKNSQSAKLMKQRTLWASLISLSRNCKVKKTNNATQTGLVHTLSKKGVILLHKSEGKVIKDKIILDDIVCVECFNIQMSNKNKFKTDQEISKQSKVQKRQLQQWEGEESASLSFNIKDYKGWDQFETNAQKFGVVSTYDENLYTTPVPHISELTEEQLLRAKIVEKELSGSTQDKEDKEDEEAMFGAVLGSGRYENSIRSGSKKSLKKPEEKYKKNRKVPEIAKKEFGKVTIKESVDSLNLTPPKLEVDEKFPKTLKIFKHTAESKIPISPLKQSPNDISPKITSIPKVLFI